MANPTDQHTALPPGVRALLSEISDALDLPAGDIRLAWRAADVRAAVKALGRAGTDRDAAALAGVMHGWTHS
jgi:hypothetical protein